MLNVKIGNMLSAKTFGWVNPVYNNGKSLLNEKIFAVKFPENEKVVRNAIFNNQLKAGMCLTRKAVILNNTNIKEFNGNSDVSSLMTNPLADERYIINANIKENIESDDSLENIYNIFQKINQHCSHYGIKSIAMPLIGAGIHGTLKEQDVVDMLIDEFCFSELLIEIWTSDWNIRKRLDLTEFALDFMPKG